MEAFKIFATMSLADAISRPLGVIRSGLRATGADVDGLGAHLGRLAVGLGKPALAALGAAALSTGAEASVVATGLNAVFTRLTQGEAAAKRASGAFKKLGLDAGEVSKSMQVDAQGTFVSVLEKIAGLSADEQLSVINQIFGQETIKTIAPMLGNLDALKSAFGMVGDAANYAGSMQGEYEARAATTENSLQLMKNAFNVLSITVGGLFLPVIDATAKAVSFFTKGLIALARTETGGFLLKLAAGVSAALVAVTGFTVALAVLKPAILIVKAALAPVIWPILAVAGAVALLSLAWKNNWGGMADKASAVWGKIKLFGEGLKAIFATIGDGYYSMSEDLAGRLEAGGLMGLVLTVGKVGFRIINFFQGFGQSLKAGFAEIWAGLAPVFADLGAVFTPLIETVKKLAGQLFGAAEGAEVSTWTALGKTVAGVVMAPFKLLGGLLGMVTKIFTGLFKVLVPVAMMLAEKLAPTALKLWNALKGLAGAVGGLIGKFFSFAEALFGLSNANDVSIWETLGGVLGGILSAALSLVTAGLEAVISCLSIVVDCVSGAINALSRFCSWLGEVWAQSSGLGDFLKNVFSGAWNYLSNLDWSAIGGNIIDTLISGLSSAGQRMYDAVAGVFTKVRELLPFSDAKAGPFASLTASGAAFVSTLIEGIQSKAAAIYDTVSGVLGRVKNLIWGSDAKEGPMSTTTASGMAFPATLAKGITAGSPALYSASAKMLGGLDLTPPPIALSAYGHNMAAPYFELPTAAPLGLRRDELPPPRFSRGRPEGAAETMPRPLKAEGGRAVHIHIAKLELPAVKDGRDFIKTLEALASENLEH